MVDQLKVGVAQMCSGIAPKANLARIEAFAKQANAQNVHYLLTPEMSVAFGESVEQLSAVAEPFEGSTTLAQCGKIAREYNLFLHIGSLAVLLSDGRFANRSILFDPNGSVLSVYDKIHLFDADVLGDDPYRESDNYRAGRELNCTDFGVAKIGMSICYDVRFGALYRQLALAGAQIISVPSAFTVPTGRAHWETLLRARAIETGCFVLAAAQGGMHENGRQTYGHSMIVDPWGAVLAEQKDDVEGLIMAEVDLEKVDEARMAIPSLKNNANFV